MPFYFYIFLFIAEAIIFIGHYLVYKSIAISFNIQNTTILWALRYIFSILSVSFFATTIYTRYSNNFIGRLLYRIAAAWMGFFIYLFASAVIILLVYSYALIFNTGLPFSLEALSIFLFALSAILGIYGLINAQNIKLQHHDLRLPQLPEYWRGKKLVFLSDTHFGQSRNINLANKIVGLVNSVQPDLVLHGGDFFDGVTIDFQQTAEVFAQIKSTHGIYFATGNHESFEDDTVYTHPMEKAGIHVLNNQIVDIEGLHIVGAEYSKTETTELFSEFMSQQHLDQTKPHILIKHVPVNLEIAEKSGIQFMLSGHTHRGQLWPFRYITQRTFKGYDYGLKKYKQMQIYTSSGAGTWGPPMKVFTAAEIVVFNLI